MTPLTLIFSRDSYTFFQIPAARRKIAEYLHNFLVVVRSPLIFKTKEGIRQRRVVGLKAGPPIITQHQRRIEQFSQKYYVVHKL